MRQDTDFDRLVDEIPNPEYDELTPLEQQIAHMASQGETDVTIANRLQIPETGVPRHLATIYKKLFTWTMGGGPSKPFPKET
jgi:DNA-binding NarL/FixJ family response regulator